MALGYQLSKYGADGKWSGSGETYNAILSFQTYCKNTYAGVQQGTSQNRERFEHFNGVAATGKLDKATYEALQKEALKRVNAGKGERGTSTQKGDINKSTDISEDYISEGSWIDLLVGVLKSIDDSQYLGLIGFTNDKIRLLEGKEEYDWNYKKSTNSSFALGYKAGSYANAVFGIKNLASGLKKIITSGGTVIATPSGDLVQVISGTLKGIKEAIKGYWVTYISIKNGASTPNIPKRRRGPVPDKAYDTLKKIEANGGKAPEGYVGGVDYRNQPNTKLEERQKYQIKTLQTIESMMLMSLTDGIRGGLKE